ncbi:hypothetical protein K432DRAFT_111501 [Lepidopterella palustris CBS 459.81]|uniref:Uncharacterized protein n=1 Tax=Lepidopterella palustris CBS 459.81 TaxID=1314670 RepID=A0A8E2JLD5_9PEZI|nr:hypothetical protein K432DRAFT_111501 [Lepidopterella palustris CBS 459.81]
MHTACMPYSFQHQHQRVLPTHTGLVGSLLFIFLSSDCDVWSGWWPGLLFFYLFWNEFCVLGAMSSYWAELWGPGWGGVLAMADAR